MEVILFLATAILVALLLVVLFQLKSYSGINLPPGKMGLPIIGESLEYVAALQKGAMKKFIDDRMRAFSPEIFKTSLLGENVIVFCSQAGHKFLFSNENKLVQGWWPSTYRKIFTSDQQSSRKKPVNKVMRKIVQGFFKGETLRNHIHVIDSTAKKQLELIKLSNDEESVVAVFPLVKMFTSGLACKLFMSIEDPVHAAKVIKHTDHLAAGVIAIPIDFPGTTFNSAIKSAKLVKKEILLVTKQRKIDLAEKKASATQDILSHMLLISDEDGVFMSETEIGNRILGLLMAGYNTSSRAITAVVKYLGELPHIYNEVLREQTEIANAKEPGKCLNWDDVQMMNFSWNVACEAMRLDSPAKGSFREALTDFTYAGYLIPKGWKLHWTTTATHKNPDYFPNPSKFDPSRFEGNGPAPYTYVPFGGGPRLCPGKEYARLEILVFMHHLVRRYRMEKMVPEGKTNSTPIQAKDVRVRLRRHSKGISQVFEVLPKNRDELQCRGSLDKVLKWYQWIVVYPTLKKLVDDMGFEKFCLIKAENSDNRLIHALVERWWLSTSTFHFPCGELGFKPLDFVILTSISFGRGRELPYDERYSKLEEGKKMFPGSQAPTSGYLATLTNYDIIGASLFDWGTLIMAALYRGLDEVSILRDRKAIGDPRDMGWFMDVAGPNDPIPIPVIQVPYLCLTTYSTNELWHQNQGIRYAAYEDSRELADNNTELRRELRQRDEIIRETSEKLVEMFISYQTEPVVQYTYDESLALSRRTRQRRRSRPS
ncbi:hypothetical protein GIB67_006534 [Kingdonia uniflora]|uniref:Cytochrome P450 n=1 Tax=Kingdonia uniflora TaxID=39325 RepID=A0A7J7LEV8_9MAGN|nr:hypothetical protein GIB67_006534 [Kingdonia uniflora]